LKPSRASFRKSKEVQTKSLFGEPLNEKKGKGGTAIASGR